MLELVLVPCVMHAMCRAVPRTLTFDRSEFTKARVAGYMYSMIEDAADRIRKRKETYICTVTYAKVHICVIICVSLLGIAHIGYTNLERLGVCPKSASAPPYGDGPGCGARVGSEAIRLEDQADVVRPSEGWTQEGQASKYHAHLPQQQPPL